MTDSAESSGVVGTRSQQQASTRLDSSSLFFFVLLAPAKRIRKCSEDVVCCCSAASEITLKDNFFFATLHAKITRIKVVFLGPGGERKTFPHCNDKNES